ncbi:MAG: hypothetical protein Kow00114_23510 [Kiloniellaceae bacterium]
MLRRIEHRLPKADGPDCVKALRAVEVPSYRISETIYLADGVVPAQQHDWAILSLALEGGYRMDWGRGKLNCRAA